MTQETGKEASVPVENHHLTISREIALPSFPRNRCPNTDDGSAGETAICTGSDRVPLIFAVNEKVGRHPGYLTLDKALDRFGIMMFPEEWGRLPGWHQIPFMMSRNKSRYIMPRLQKIPSSKKRQIVDVPVVASNRDDELTKRCADIFWSACKAFRSSLRRKDIFLYGSNPKLAEKIKIRSRGIFSARRVDIFYTGTAPLQCNDNKVRRCRLYVGKRAFDRWINFLTYEHLALTLRTNIDIFSINNNLRLTKESWNMITSPIFETYKLKYLDQFMRENVFEKLSARKGKGRPRKVAKDVFQRRMDELTAMVAAEVARFQSDLSAGQGRPKGKIPYASIR